MTATTFKLALLCLAREAFGLSVSPFAEEIFGVWMPKKGVPTKSILGPVAYDFLSSGPGKMNVGFTALRDARTGSVWFTLLNGQMFRVTGKEMQYCFGADARPYLLQEQSPFEVDQVTNTSVNFCWRSGDRGMPTHAKGCSGCGCARILLNLTDYDTLRFQFWQSPPVLHADLQFVRSGPQPRFEDAISSTMIMPYVQCKMRDHYGPNIPGEPDLRNRTYKLAGGCVRTLMPATMRDDDADELLVQTMNGMTESAKVAAGQCRQLNGVNLHLDQASRKNDPSKVMNISDVRMQYVPPVGHCDPCDVSYSISAEIKEDEYIGFGFKGQSWEAKDPYPPQVARPCYFGMCVDTFDNFTSDRIAVGYTTHGGGCVREMVAKHIIGSPVDVDFMLLKMTSVERNGTRTILRFTISQHWPRHPGTARYSDGPFRVMWAIGKVGGGVGCASDLGYHSNHRGVAPVEWLQSGSTPCTYNPEEMARSEPVVV